MIYSVCITLVTLWCGSPPPKGADSAAVKEFQIQASADPPTLLLSSGGTVRVQIQVKDANGAPVSGARVEGLARYGRLEEVRDRGFGRYEVLYRPPAERYPQLEMVVLRVPGRGVGWLPLPLIGSGTLQAELRPGAQVRLSVQERVFGPVQAYSDGLVRVPFEAPPGISKGTLITGEGPQDEQKRQIRLSVPPVQSLLILPDRSSLVADGKSEALLELFVADEENLPLSGAALELRADRGMVSRPKECGPGLYQATFRAPDELSDGTVTLQTLIKGRGPRYQAVHQLRLSPGPPRKLELRYPKGPVAARGRTQIRLEALVKDERDNPTDDAVVSFAASFGELGVPIRQSPGTTAVILEVSGVPVGIEEIEITAKTDGQGGVILREQIMLSVTHPAVQLSVRKPKPPFWRSLGFYKWATLITSGLALLPGTALLALDGQGSCSASAPVQCPEIYDTRPAGMTLLALGSALLLTSGGLFLLDRDRPQIGSDPTLALQPTRDGAYLLLSGWLPY